MANPDFVQVRLTAAGQKLAGPHPLSIANGRRAFQFSGSDAQKVETSYEWKAFLSRQHTPAGDAMFELVPDPAAAIGATPVPATPAITAAPAPSPKPTA